MLSKPLLERHKVASARSTLGVPFIPPVALSASSNRLRRLIGRCHRTLAPPPVQILESALSLLEHRVPVIVCKAGIPDALDVPMSLDALAAATGADRDRLERVIQYSSSRGWLKLDRRGVIHPTTTTRFLRSDHPGGWRAWIEFLGGDHVGAAVAALDLADPTDGFERVNGSPFFAWLHEHPDEGTVFDDTMAAGARMHALTLDAAVNWRGTSSVCDIGGGTGELLRTLLERHTDWNATVLDLPATIARAVEHPRLAALGGDAFTAVPNGYDVYLLVNVLHDWNDADATRLLRVVADACGPDARVLIVENLRHSTPRDDLAIRADVLMAALTNGGRERTRSEFATLAADAGIRLTNVKQLASADHVLEFRTSRA